MLPGAMVGSKKHFLRFIRGCIYRQGQTAVHAERDRVPPLHCAYMAGTSAYVKSMLAGPISSDYLLLLITLSLRRKIATVPFQ